MEIKKLINPNGFFPSAVIAVCELEGIDYAVFPNCEKYVLKISEFTEDDYFIVFTPPVIKHLERKGGVDKTIIHDEEYAYAINNELVLVGTHERIISYLKRLLALDWLSKSEKITIREYIENTTNSDNAVSFAGQTWGELLQEFKEYDALELIISSRKLKGHENKIAKRVIVQFHKNANIKTAYRKNMHYQEDALVKTISPSVSELINSIMH